MKIHAFALLSIVMAILTAPTPKAHAQGALTPPTAPAPSMKSLDQIEPRIPISSLPYTITTSGSYYVTTNLVLTSSQFGITILTNDVSIDLRGYTLNGTGIGQVGIYTTGNYTNLTVFNGGLESWNYGVYILSAFNVIIDHLTVANCAVKGIQLNAQSLIKDSAVTGNLTGIQMSNGTVENTVATANRSAGIEIDDNGTVKNCRAVSNAGAGIVINSGSVIDCVAEGSGASAKAGIYILTTALIKNSQSSYNTNYGVYCQSGTVSDCQAIGNGSAGFFAFSDANFVNCSSSVNGGNGFYIGNHGSAANCVADLNTSDNFYLTSACNVSQCTATQSKSGSGFFLSYMGNIGNSMAYSNFVYGINASQRVSVNNCVANWNGTAGIHAAYISTVQSCQCAENGVYGIFSDGGGLVNILQNNCAHNGITSTVGTPTVGAGIFVTNSPYGRIDNNTCVFNNYGIVVAPNSRCLITKNGATTSTTANYSFATGNTYGPIVSVGGVSDMSATAGANHPQANFSY